MKQMIKKLMKMPKKIPMKRLSKHEQLIYDTGYHNGIMQGRQEKIEEIKKILEIDL